MVQSITFKIVAWFCLVAAFANLYAVIFGVPGPPGFSPLGQLIIWLFLSGVAYLLSNLR